MMPAPRHDLSVAGGGQFSLPAGVITDDTMMTLAMLRTYLFSGRFHQDAFLLHMTEIVRRKTG